ncbi:MAG TPA: hypothetical protein VFN21_07125 [Acidimicrobiales bacterium]|nr:hypothetical protein [Acidimicrobiales bacterium]
MSLVADRHTTDPVTITRQASETERFFSSVVFWAGLALLIASAWWYGRGLWFYSDEWNIIAVHHSGHWMEGFNGQWLLIPTLFFRILLEIFGLFTYWPFRLVGLAWYASLIIVFHTWARRRVRPAAAALAALAVAWYSTSWNVVMMPLLMNFTIPCVMLFAVWMLLDRNDRRGDVWVAVCLLVGMLSSNVGLVVCVIIGVEFVLSRAPWRRWWVFVPSVVVWVPWFLIWYEPISKRAAVTHAAHWGIGLTENYAKGFFAGWRAGQWVWLAALIGVAIWALWRRRWNARSIGAVIGLAFFVVGASFRAADFHIPVPPDPNWYLWFYSVLVAALLVELARGAKVPLSLLGAVAVVVAISGSQLHGSLADFHSNGKLLQRNARTWFAAADALGAKAPADATMGVNIVQLPVGDYAGLRRDMGSLAPDVTLAQLGDEGTRQTVDAWMVTKLGIEISPGAGAGGACRVATGARGPGGSGLPPGAMVRVTTTGEAATLKVRRFASGFSSTSIGEVSPNQTVHFTIPTDNSSVPWHLQADGNAEVSVCS